MEYIRGLQKQGIRQGGKNGKKATRRREERGVGQKEDRRTEGRANGRKEDWKKERMNGVVDKRRAEKSEDGMTSVRIDRRVKETPDKTEEWMEEFIPDEGLVGWDEGRGIIVSSEETLDMDMRFDDLHYIDADISEVNLSVRNLPSI